MTSPEAKGLDEAAKGLLMYELITLRELDHEALQWQAPTLALTAQAFLFTVTLDPGFPIAARLVSAFLGVLILLMALQLMTKHRHFADVELDRLEKLEKDLELPPTARHKWIRADGATAEQAWARTPFWTRWSSYLIWVIGIWVMVVVNIGVAIVALF